MIRTFDRRFKGPSVLAGKLHHWLKQRTADPRRSLIQFTRGGFLFAAGVMIILLAERAITPGIAQEASALFGLLLSTTGGIMALWGYLGISLFKLFIDILDRDTRE